MAEQSLERRAAGVGKSARRSSSAAGLRSALMAHVPSSTALRESLIRAGRRLRGREHDIAYLAGLIELTRYDPVAQEHSYVN